MVTIGTTYRVQVRPAFGLDATADLTDYLSSLGVTHLYTAPLLTAVTGSQHNYDVADPTTVNAQLGGRPALETLVARLRERGMGLVVDIVPNHVGVAIPHENPAWWSVLRDGQSSRYARWFDIDWARGEILIPVLADDDAIADLQIEGDELRYCEHRYPIAPGTEGGTPQEVHDRQHYRLIGWRRGDQELTYRRFFAVADLAGVRVENPAVFAETHGEILSWVDGDLVDGLRVDHPDGLRDPGRYLARLRAAAPDTWIVVEKILEYGEAMPDWPVDGTTGYDALREVCGVFVDGNAAASFPAEITFEQAAQDGKREVAHRLLGAELARLNRLAGAVPYAVEAFAEISAQMPVYRTYLPEGQEILREAVVAAHVALSGNGTFADATPDLADLLRDPDSELAQRFQQFTGADMGKGVEDTAFYRWTRFVALNEVGGSPAHFGVPVAEFHAALAARLRDFPNGMTTLSTHDTKRGEDVRARLAVLAEVPGEWHTAVASWSSLAPLPDEAIAQLLWQCAAGTWPIERERLHAYAEKASREANTSTGWADPDAEFEATMHGIIDAMYDHPDLNASLSAFVATITEPGWHNSLGQKLVQLTMPGVPDTYQGTELWDNSLVDPDNRRDVDFSLRQSLLRQLDDGLQPPIDADGAVKLLVTSRALRLRRDHPELFTGYTPLFASGAAADHVVAFDRGGAITVVTRLPVALARRGGFGSEDVLALPAGSWRDVLTGRTVTGSLRELLDIYPVALLVAA